MYLSFAVVSFFLIFDHRLTKHPLFLKNQIALEIQCQSILFMGLLTLPIMVAEVRGFANCSHHCWISHVHQLFDILDTPLFAQSHILHKYIHKGHHKWKVPTHFASHTFHPIDAWFKGKKWNTVENSSLLNLLKFYLQVIFLERHMRYIVSLLMQKELILRYSVCLS